MILNGTFVEPLTSTVPATHTSEVLVFFANAPTRPAETDADIPFSVRIVSDVPVAATMSHTFGVANILTINCVPLQP